LATLRAMAKTLTAYLNRKKAEQELFTARKTLTHLVQLYENGQWRRLYKEDIFVGTVRKARETVEHWTGVLERSDRTE
jgi:hypothetical protein